jgi:(p)ppGpp synthase/HD superfamily hydrolase
MGEGDSMTDRNTDIAIAIRALMEATMFAADKHRGQKRKDAQGTPYINHPIMVVNLMSRVGGITDVEALQAGMLHDTVEDTETSPEEIEERFGYGVRCIVMEVTDDKSLEKPERKRIQVEKAPNLSPRAQLIKIADKTANLTDLVNSPPAGWAEERIRQYVEWSGKVVAGCRGQNERLEQAYDAKALEAIAGLS